VKERPSLRFSLDEVAEDSGARSRTVAYSS
jgi:hypothetical protein